MPGAELMPQLPKEGCMIFLRANESLAIFRLHGKDLLFLHDFAGAVEAEAKCLCCQKVAIVLQPKTPGKLAKLRHSEN